MENNKASNQKVRVVLVVALASIYLWQIGEAYLNQEPIRAFLYIGLLVAIALSVLIIRDR